MKLFDYIALVITVSFTVIVFIGSFSVKSSFLEVYIESENKTWIYPLKSFNEQSISGPSGNTVFVIENGFVYIQESDCSEKTCIKSGKIWKQGQWLACLPNRVFIGIRGNEESELDGEAY